MLDGVDVEGPVVHQNVGVPLGIPGLPPPEVPELLLGKPLLPGVVYPLDDGARDGGLLQEVGHGRPMPERVDGPARLRLDAEGSVQPLVT